MGLFDFLHGGKPPKSEAEEYMEQRNKEYTRKVAEYKRKETVENMSQYLGDSVHGGIQEALRNNSKNVDGVQTLGGVFGAAAGAMFQSFGKVLSELSQQSGQNGSSTQRTVTRDGNRVVTTTKTSTSTSSYKKKTLDCNECNSSKSIYDGKEAALLLVQGASVKSATRTMIVVGEIQRGGLEVGDKVTVISSLEANDVIIAAMYRKNEPIDYANGSAGQIALAFNNASFMVRAGDKVVKKK